MKARTLAMLNIQEPGAHRPHGLPLLRLGFRPFYLGAALVAVGNVAVWALLTLGLWSWAPPLPALWWHAHEMLYGFVAAVIVGFLLTAGRNWTGRPTPRGVWLGLLVGLWLAARLAALQAPAPLFAALDVVLLPCIAVVLLRLLWSATRRRNLPIVGILALLSAANLVFHLAALGWLDLSPLQALHAALALVVVLEMVMGGRVIPGFTMSALPGVKIAPRPGLDRASLALGATGLLLWVLALEGPVATPLLAAVLLAAAGLHALRAWHWQPLQTLRLPMLWILHAAHAWIPLGLLLLALATLGWVHPSLAVHALAVGATGGLILGMMARTARGHTGRTQQPGWLERACFALVLAAALVRVLLPWLAPGLYRQAIGLSAALWCLAFGLFLLQYTPWLVRGRIDGSDG